VRIRKAISIIEKLVTKNEKLEIENEIQILIPSTKPEHQIFDYYWE